MILQLDSYNTILLFSFVQDRDWTRNQLRLLSPRSSGKAAAIDIMIPPATVATTMEFKCGLLCSTGEDVCSTYGQFPLLGSTKSLLAKLGFELCDNNDDDDDSKNVHTNDDVGGGGGGRQCSPLAALVQPSENITPMDTNNNGEQLSDILLRALDDVRDMRHRVEEDECAEQQNGRESGKKTISKSSRRAKRIDHQVDSLEKQRAKLLEKEKEKNDGCNDDNDNDDDDYKKKNMAEIRDAWMRIARTYNSARLLLFLFSEEDGLDILAGGYGNNNGDGDGDGNNGDDGKVTGMKGIIKSFHKLSDALGVLAMSSTSGESNVDDGDNSDDDDGDGDDSQGITMCRDTINEWEKYISTAIRSRRNTSTAIAVVNDRVNDSVVDLTDDDSSTDSNNTDAETEKDDNNVQIQSKSSDGQNDEVTSMDAAIGDVSNQKNNKNRISARCHSWNAHLDKLMKDLVATVTTNIGSGETEFLEQSFGAMSLSSSLNDVNGGAPRDSATAALHERAKNLDERFSLIVGITGSKEYQKRKKYLLSIERLRQRVEQRIRQGRRNHEFQDARLDVYGSCLSGLSLGKNADVDLSLTFSEAIERKTDFEAGDLTAKKYSRHVTDTVYKIKRKLESRGPSMVGEFRDIEAVPRARVPVIKGVYTDANNPHSEDGSLQFDICLLNDIAVVNSGLIKEYSDVDIRVKSLMVAVKRWTKDNKINSAQDNTLSSYTWMNMVIFYLQCIGFVPNLQCPRLMRECNHDMGWGESRRRQDNINNLNTAYLKWKGEADLAWKRSPEVDDAYASLSMLLYGFFRFYSREYPIHLYLVSIKRGGTIRLPKTMFLDRASLHLCIEDPFETYDSHFPHDLGTPADEAGSMFISQCFRNSSDHLRRVLLGDDATKDEIDDVEELWPISTPAAKNGSGRARRTRNTKPEKRDPRMTLVIEIVGGKNIKKEDILEIFRPFADQTKANVVGSSLTGGGRLAFVDYDSIAAVHAALAAHANTPLEWNGEALCVSQKAQAVVLKASSQRRSKKTNNNVDKSPKKEPKNEQKKEKAQNVPSDSGKADTPKGSSSSSKGHPDNTLVVQNISGSVSGEGLAKIFRPFADQTNSRLVSADLVKKKTIAFIEYDSSEAVRVALKEHSEKPLQWNGRALDVAQKLPSGWKRREKQQARGKDTDDVTHTEKRAPKQSPTNTQSQDCASPPDSPKQAKKKASKKAGKKNSGKKQERKKKLGGGGNNNEKGKDNPILDANKSIQEQL